MNKADIILAVDAIRTIELQRVSTWILKDALTKLESLNRDVAELAMSSGVLDMQSARSRKRIENELMREIELLTKEVIDEIRRRIESTFDDVIEVTREDQKSVWFLVYGMTLFGRDEASGANLLIGGATIEDHLGKVSDDYIFRVMSQVRDSVAAGEAETELYHRIKGTMKVDGPVGEILQAQRRVETVTRTAATAILNAVQLELQPRANVIAPHGWQHKSVLDARTSDVCRSRSNKKWDANKNPIGHNLAFRQPPLHDNCRSKLQLIFIDEPESAELNFRQWLETIPLGERNTIFGQENLKRWKAAKISDAELIRQANRPLSLDEWKERAKNRQGRFPF